MTFASRREAFDAQVHRQLQAGIAGKAQTGAESVVVSGGYEDDEDLGAKIIYTGHGGQDRSGKQVSDQSFESSGNAALLTSKLQATPVRVIRRVDAGYRYDGLFRVADAWLAEGSRGPKVCRFRLVKLQSDSFLPEVGGDGRMPTGSGTPGRRTVTTQRIVRSTAVVEHVKGIYGNRCQVCAIRLLIGSRAYSEGAHIRALGAPHNGPDFIENVLCLCPNCHVQFDNGALLIEDDLSITCNGSPAGNLYVDPRHAVEREYLQYHRDNYGFGSSV